MGNMVLWKGDVYLIGPNCKLTCVQYWKPSKAYPMGLREVMDLLKVHVGIFLKC
jgi:hypothetical protein